MFSKILFFYEDDDWKNIDIHLRDIPQPFQVITNSDLLNNFLKKLNINSRTLTEIFPYDQPITYEVNNIASNLLEHYKKLFDKIMFRGFEIFDSLEQQILSEILFYTKTTKILQEKVNTIFIFEGYSFSYFILQKFLSDSKFSTDELKIQRIDSKHSEYIELGQSQIIYNYKRKLNYLLSKSDKISIIKLLSMKFLKSINRKSTFKIQKNIDSKILKSVSKINPECIFFFTPSSDYVVAPIVNILNKFNETNAKYQNIVFDLDTNLILRRNGIVPINFFQEAFSLSKILRDSNECQELLKQIKKIILENKLEVLYAEKFFNPVIFGIFYLLAIMIICDHIFNNIKLKSIVAVNDGNKIGNSVITTAKKHGIPNYSICTLGLTPDPLNRFQFKADVICVYGLHGYNILKNLGYNTEKIINTGNPRYDYLSNIDITKQKKLLNNIYSLSANKLVVVGLGRWRKNDEIWMSNLIKFCNNNNFDIVIKVHPIYKTSMQYIHKQKIKEIKKRCNNMKYLITYDIDSSMLLSSADLVISDHSNFGIEATLLGKPLITTNFSNENLELIQSIFDYEHSFFVDEYNKMENMIFEILNEGKHLNELKNKRKELIEKQNHLNDGNASQRIVDLLLKK